MSAPITSHPSSIPSSKTRSQRARSLPSAGPFRVAVFFSLMHYLGLVTVVTAFVGVILHPGGMGTWLLVGGVVYNVITWLIAFFRRRSTLCPLCKGTPLLNSGAHVHSRAWRFWPLNHGTTAILSIMATQKFRCMYCGSDFDLFKPRTRILYGDIEGSESCDCNHHDKRC
jgi:hypothetical protein